MLSSGGTGLCSTWTWVERRTTSPGSTIAVSAMNIGTFAPGRSAPADHFKKDANGFDLPIALEPILGSGQVAFDRPGNFAISGDLAITGEARLGWRIHASGTVVAIERTWVVGTSGF